MRLLSNGGRKQRSGRAAHSAVAGTERQLERPLVPKKVLRTFEGKQLIRAQN